MEEFLSTIVRGKTSAWTIAFLDSTIELRLNGVEARVDLKKYPCDVRKDFIRKLRSADISSLAIKSIIVRDDYFKEFWWRNSYELSDGHAALTEDIVEIIKALQSTPTVEESNVVGDGESQNGQAKCNLMEATVSSTHQMNDRILTDIRILGDLPPQKLRAVCSLIVAPGSKVKLVKVVPWAYGYPRDGTLPLQCMVLEEMLSAQKKGGSCPALESLIFDFQLMWNFASVERLGKFLHRTPSIKEIDFSWARKDSGHSRMRIEWTLAEKLAEVLCLNNEVQALHVARPCVDLLEGVMRVLMRDSQRQHPITALNCLHLEYLEYQAWNRNESLLVEFIKTTKCLNALKLTLHTIAKPFQVIRALKFNHGLEHFTWVVEHRPSGNDDYEAAIFSTIMDALRVNHQLKDFKYPWRNNYYAEALTMFFEERATNKPWDTMKDMVLVPSTSARLFFCGYPFAGETL